VCNPKPELGDISELQHCNESGAVVLLLEKLRSQMKKERKINFRSLQPGKRPVVCTMTDHSPWRAGYNQGRVNVSILVGKVTLDYAYVRVLFYNF